VNEQVAAQARENGLLWLDGYERVPQDLLDLEEGAAKANRRGLGNQVGHRERESRPAGRRGVLPAPERTLES